MKYLDEQSGCGVEIRNLKNVGYFVDLLKNSSLDKAELVKQLGEDLGLENYHNSHYMNIATCDGIIYDCGKYNLSLDSIISNARGLDFVSDDLALPIDFDKKKHFGPYIPFSFDKGHSDWFSKLCRINNPSLERYLFFGKGMNTQMFDDKNRNKNYGQIYVSICRNDNGLMQLGLSIHDFKSDSQ